MLEQISLKIIELFQSLGTLEAYLLILGVLLGCGLGVPIPEDITLISAGIISASGTISVEGALVAGIVGVLLGDAFLFMLGRKYGRRVYTWPFFRRIFTPDRIHSAEARVLRNAKLICFSARFMPGLRAPIYLTAGTMGVKPSLFLIADGFAALISVPIWIFLGNWFGSNIDQVLVYAKKINTGILIVLALAVVGFLIYRRLKKPKPA